MTTDRAPVDAEAWETISGLPDDVDVYMRNVLFGFKDEYAKIAGSDSPMLIFDLVNAEGEVLGSQGYSCGGGWVVGDGGGSISHPLREKIVKTSIYGQFIDRVVKVLKVEMQKYGSPLNARSWEGLGFHMKQEMHATVGGDQKPSLMPTEFLGEGAAVAPAPAAGKGTTAGTPIEAKLTTLAQNLDLDTFKKAALKLPDVAANDELLAAVLDDSETGFWATHKEG